MKKVYLVMLAASSLLVTESFGQTYCIPPSFLPPSPYTGIENVTLDVIDNSTAWDDGYSDYTATAGTPDLTIDSSYTLSVSTHHDLGVSPPFSGRLNVTVWIDWNDDGTFDDPAEAVLDKDSVFPGTETVTFMVPSNADTGITRMRVYNDMLKSEGHKDPIPCGYSDGIGQHGEAEDYHVNIVANVASGLRFLEAKESSVKLVARFESSDHLFINYSGLDTGSSLTVYDIVGNSVYHESLKKERAMLDLLK